MRRLIEWFNRYRWRRKVRRLFRNTQGTPMGQLMDDIRNAPKTHWEGGPDAERHIIDARARFPLWVLEIGVFPSRKEFYALAKAQIKPLSSWNISSGKATGPLVYPMEYTPDE